MVQTSQDGDLSQRSYWEIRTLTYLEFLYGVDLASWHLKRSVYNSILALVNFVKSFVAVDILAPLT